MNTGLAVGTAPTPGFVAWRAYCASHPDLAVGQLIKRGTPHLTDAEVAAYDAPFPTCATRPAYAPSRSS